MDLVHQNLHSILDLLHQNLHCRAVVLIVSNYLTLADQVESVVDLNTESTFVVDLEVHTNQEDLVSFVAHSKEDTQIGFVEEVRTNPWKVVTKK